MPSAPIASQALVEIGDGRYHVACGGTCGGGSGWHVVTIGADAATCDCPGHAFRQGCRHVDAVTEYLRLAPVKSFTGEKNAPSPVETSTAAGPGLERDVALPDPPTRAIAAAAIAGDSRAADAAEQAVLSAILLAHTVPPAVAGILEPLMFQREAHRLLYRGMLALTRQGAPVDPVTLAAAGNGDVERTGGIEYVAALIDVVPSADHVEAYARAVRDHARRREVAAMGRQMQDAGVDLVGALERVSALLSGLVSPTTSRFRLLTLEELLARPPRTWVLDEHIPAGGLVVLYGPAGTGKSFVALSQDCAIAAGVPWLRWATRSGLVVFAAGEGGAGLGQRLRAWLEAEGVAALPRLRIIDEPVNLLNPADVDALLASVSRAGDEPPALFTFDTLADSMPGGDENTARDMGAVVHQARRIARLTGAAVRLIHHTGRDESRQKSERGSTALRGAADTMFHLTGEDGALTLENDKQRDREQVAPLPLRLYPIAGSCVIQPNEASPAAEPAMGKNHWKALRALAENFVGEESGAIAWLKVSGIPEGSFYKTIKLLVKIGYVAKAKGKYVVSAAGAAALKGSYPGTISELSDSEPSTTYRPGGLR